MVKLNAGQIYRGGQAGEAPVCPFDACNQGLRQLVLSSRAGCNVRKRAYETLSACQQRTGKVHHVDGGEATAHDEAGGSSASSSVPSESAAQLDVQWLLDMLLPVQSTSRRGSSKNDQQNGKLRPGLSGSLVKNGFDCRLLAKALKLLLPQSTSAALLEEQEQREVLLEHCLLLLAEDPEALWLFVELDELLPPHDITPSITATISEAVRRLKVGHEHLNTSHSKLLRAVGLKYESVWEDVFLDVEGAEHNVRACQGDDGMWKLQLPSDVEIVDLLSGVVSAERHSSIDEAELEKRGRASIDSILRIFQGLQVSEGEKASAVGLDCEWTPGETDEISLVQVAFHESECSRPVVFLVDFVALGQKVGARLAQYLLTDCTERLIAFGREDIKRLERIFSRLALENGRDEDATRALLCSLEEAVEVTDLSSLDLMRKATVQTTSTTTSVEPFVGTDASSTRRRSYFSLGSLVEAVFPGYTLDKALQCSPWGSRTHFFHHSFLLRRLIFFSCHVANQRKVFTIYM